jgi:hypothetical protein
VELCLDPVYAIDLLKSYGWHTVNYFIVPYDQLKSTKDTIAHLPDVEGAVVYHMNPAGVIQLEKAKACGYVVIRAIREKSKGFIRGRKSQPGLEDDVKMMEENIASLHADTLGKLTDDGYIMELKGFEHIGLLLKSLGGSIL